MPQEEQKNEDDIVEAMRTAIWHCADAARRASEETRVAAPAQAYAEAASTLVTALRHFQRS